MGCSAVGCTNRHKPGDTSGIQMHKVSLFVELYLMHVVNSSLFDDSTARGNIA